MPLTGGTREPTIAPSARDARERGPVPSGGGGLLDRVLRIGSMPIQARSELARR